MLTTFLNRILVGCLCAVCLISCSKSGPADGNSPVLPSTNPELSDSQAVDTGSSGHYLWAYFMVTIDSDTLEAEIVPVRLAEGHFNVLGWLENGPCFNCFKLPNITQNADGTLAVTVRLRHPFQSQNLTGFDVRGIAMFDGSHVFTAAGKVMSDRNLGEGEILNADGYTSLFNPTTAGYGLEGYMQGKFATDIAPTSTVNGYKVFVSEGDDNTRNMFYVGDEVEVVYTVDMPDAPNPWRFGYAVDACWAPPVIKPVENPGGDFGLDANCVEPRFTYLEDQGPGLNPSGGSASLYIALYDRQGNDTVNPPGVICDELFDGIKWATLKDEFLEFTVWEVEIENEKLAGLGTYRCLVMAEAKENDPITKPWLDLTTYAYIDLKVTDLIMEDVTPDWLNFRPGEVRTAGGYLYMAGGPGLHIFDVSDKSNPVWVSVFDEDKLFYGIEVSGNYAYVLSHVVPGSTLSILDISNPGFPVISKEVHVNGLAGVIEVKDGYAYVGSNAILSIVDVDPPESAYVVKSMDTGAIINGISYSEGYVCLAHSGWSANGKKMEIFDVDPPEDAYSLILVDMPSNARGIEISGDYAYVGLTDKKVEVVDVNPPIEAHIVGAFMGMAEYLEVEGNILYTGGDADLGTYDLNDPEHPVKINVISTPDGIDGFAYQDGHVYIGDYLGLHIYDMDPPGSAYLEGAVSTPGKAVDVAIWGNHAVVAARAQLLMIDIGVPETAYVSNVVDLPDRSICLAVHDGYAYVADDSMNINIVDIDPPESAWLVHSVLMTQKAVNITVSGGYAYVMANRLYILDVDPPESAIVVADLPVHKSRNAVAVDGNFAFLVGENLTVVDIGQPDAPFIYGELIMPVLCHDIEVSGGYAYITDDEGFSIVDIGQPDQPVYVKSVDTGLPGEYVAVSGDHAFMTEDFGLHVLDITTPETAEIIATYGQLMSERTLAINGNYAYVTSYYGLRIIKVW